MKYVIVNDICSFFYKYKLYVLIFLITILASVVVQKLVGVPLDQDLFLSSLGFRTSLDYGLMAFLLFVFNCGVRIFVVAQIFNNDVKNGLENIFLRMNLNKWINIKCFSIFLLNTILTFLLYISLMIIFAINNIMLNTTLKYVFINIIFFSFVEYLFLLIYLIAKKFKWIIPIFIVVFLLCARFILVDVTVMIEKIIIFILTTLFILVLIKIITRKNFIQIFE